MISIDDFLEEFFLEADYWGFDDLFEPENPEDILKLAVGAIESILNRRCLDCQRDTQSIDEYYMVKDDVWIKANPSDDGMLCIVCLETRIGRTLESNDFTNCPLNEQNLIDGSDLLKSRLMDEVV